MVIYSCLCCVCEHQIYAVQSWSASGQTPLRSQGSQSDPKQKNDAEQVGPSKEAVKTADQAADKATDPEAPEISQEIKGLLGLAYPDLMAVAITACDSWMKGRTQARPFALLLELLCFSP